MTPSREALSVYLLDHLLRARGVVRQEGRRILDGVKQVIAATVESDDDLRPMGGSPSEAVDEHNRRLGEHGLLLPYPPACLSTLDTNKGSLKGR
jgi:hypothetical protein